MRVIQGKKTMGHIQKDPVETLIKDYQELAEQVHVALHGNASPSASLSWAEFVHETNRRNIARQTAREEAMLCPATSIHKEENAS